MKKYYPQILAGALALTVTATTSAQTVTGVFIGKGTSYVQTDATTVIVNPEPVSPTHGGAYGFEATVEGSGLSAPTVTLAAGSGIPTSDPTSHNGGVLGFNTDDMSWQYGSSNFNNWGATTAGEIDTLFANGNYTVSIPTFSPVTLNLTTPGVALNAPLLTLSSTSGFWSGGIYYVNPNETIFITSNAFTAFGSNTNGHIGFYGWDADTGASILTGAQEVDRLFTDDSTDTITSSITAGTLISGETYTIEADFAAVVDMDTSTLPGGAAAVAFWSYGTQITIQAVPEPSTYAVIAGALCLGIAMLRRRKLS